MTAPVAPPGVEPLPVVAVGELAPAAARAGWLIEQLWSAQAVGVIGGAPKSAKTWLALELAVSVASATPALGCFAVAQPGPVLLYTAEDRPEQIQARLEHLARARALELRGLDLGLILAPTLRLDHAVDRARLRRTLHDRRPQLLILDPLVRLHGLDENSATEVAALLGELRALQRQYAVAVLVVHHLRKNAPGQPDGRALRGSSDLHAGGDSNLDLRRRDDRFLLVIEHRAAPPPPPLTLELATDPTVHLRLVTAHDSQDDQPARGLADRVLAALAEAGRPLSRETLRDTLHTRNATLGDVLARLRPERKIVRADGGFALRQTAP
jgi:hypothetical protein